MTLSESAPPHTPATLTQTPRENQATTLARALPHRPPIPVLQDNAPCKEPNP
jgi:hypothetical protein